MVAILHDGRPGDMALFSILQRIRTKGLTIYDTCGLINDTCPDYSVTHPEDQDRRNMPKPLPQLSTAEWTVMKEVWKLRKTTVREVFEVLGDSQEWAYTTVQTLMERLRGKGYLSCKKVGKTNFYTPQASRRKVVMSAFDDFADQVFDGAIGPIVCHLIRKDRLSKKELREIKNLIENDEENEA